MKPGYYVDENADRLVIVYANGTYEYYDFDGLWQVGAYEHVNDSVFAVLMEPTDRIGEL